jgi:hypothetical protein
MTTILCRAASTTSKKNKSSLKSVRQKPKYTAKTIAKSCPLQYKSKFANVWLTFYSEGLMYNPVNMKIEDEKRLIEKDLRDKNKKIRY